MEVQTFTGESVHLSVSPQTSIASVKARLRERTGVPPQLQVLVAEGRTLQDQQRAGSIRGSVRLHLSSCFRVRLLLRSSKGLVRPVEVLVSDTLRTVREGIGEPDARFVADGELLEDDHTVTELIRMRKYVLDVLRPNDRIVSVQMNTHCYKVVYAERAGSSGAASNVFLASPLSCEERPLCNTQIQPGDAPTAPEFYVWVKTIGMQVKRVTISPFSPIAELSPWVIYCGRPLDPSTLVSDAGMQVGAVLEIGEVLLHICTQNVQHLKVAVIRTLSVAHLKHELESRLYINDMTLAVDGVVLSDRQDFTHCGIEATIDVVQQSDHFVWVKYEEERVAVCLPDAPCTAGAVLSLFQAATGADLQRVWLLYTGQLVTPEQTITLHSGSTLEVHSRAKQLVTVCTSSGQWRVAVSKTDRMATLEQEFRKYGRIGQLLAGGQKVPTGSIITDFASKRIVFLEECERLLTFRYRSTVLSLPINLSDTVERVKPRLQEELSLLPGFVLVQQSVLSDNTVVRHLHSDTIDVFQFADLLLWIKELDAPRRCVSVPSLTITVGKFLRLCSFSEPMLLYYLQFLSDSQTLQDCRIRPGATITAIPRKRCTLDVSVGAEDTFLLAERVAGGAVLLRYSRTHSLRDVERQLCAALGCDMLILAHDRQVLTDDELRALPAGTVVRLYTKSDGVILVECSSGRVECVHRPVPLTAESVKAACHVPADYTLYCDGKRIDGDVSNCFYLQALAPSERMCCIKRLDAPPLYLFSLKIRDFGKFQQDGELYIDGARSTGGESLTPTSDVWWLPPAHFLIRALSVDGRKADIVVSDGQSVADLQAAVAGRLGVISHLVHRCKLLNDPSQRLFTLRSSPRTAVVRKGTAEVAVTAVRPGDLLLTVTGATLHRSVAVSVHASAAQVIAGIDCSARFLESEVCVLFNGQQLAGNRSLADYSIATGATLHLLQPSEALVSLRTLDGRACWQVMPSHEVTLQAVQSVAQGICAEPKFLHVGEVSDWETLQSLGVRDEAEVCVQSRSGILRERKFTLRLRGCAVKAVSVRSTMTVAQIVASLPGTRIRLLMAGHVVEDGKRLLDYGIVADTEATIIHPGDPLLSVMTPTGSTLLLSAATTTEGLRRALSLAAGFPEDRQTVLCEGVPVEEATDLIRYAGCLLELQVRPFIKVQTTEQLQVLPLLSHTETVAEVKNRLGATCLYLDGKKLNDDQVVHSGALIQALSPHDVCLWVKTALSAPLPVYARCNDSIGQVKARIGEIFRVPPIRLRLLLTLKVENQHTFAAVQSSKVIRLFL